MFKTLSLAVVAALGLSSAHAEDFNEGAARSMCGRVTKDNGTNRDTIVDACVGIERRMFGLLEYKRSVMPKHIYVRCATVSGSMLDANACMDKEVLSLPKGSVPGIWRLQKGLEDQAFWNFQDCNSARAWGGGGVCVSD